MRRRSQLLLGTLAAVVALAAAIGAGAAVNALDDGGDARPDPEVSLKFDASDDESGQDDLLGGEVQGEATPERTFALLSGGSTSFEALHGRPVVVNFFASWCPPCVSEMPGFEEVHQELGDAVTFVGIDVRDSVRAAEELVERTGVSYMIGRDPSGEIFESFDAINMPSTFFIDADGTVVDAHAGAMKPDDLRERISTKLLK